MHTAALAIDPAAGARAPILRRHFGIQPDNAPLCTCWGHRGLGRCEAAISISRRRWRWPGNEQIQKISGEICSLEGPAAEERYLLIRAGASASGRTCPGDRLPAWPKPRGASPSPIVSESSSATGPDAFGFYLEPVSPMSFESGNGAGASFFPPRWHGGNLASPRRQMGRKGLRAGAVYFLNRPEPSRSAIYRGGCLPWLPSPIRSPEVGKYTASHRPLSQTAGDILAAQNLSGASRAGLVAVHSAARQRPRPNLAQRRYVRSKPR